MTSKNQRRQPSENTATKFRRLLTESVSDEDFRAVISALVTSAKGGDLGAAKLLIDRCCGKPSVADELEVASTADTRTEFSADTRGEPVGLKARRSALAERIAAISQ
jgi:hypothetical protein